MQDKLVGVVFKSDLAQWEVCIDPVLLSNILHFDLVSSSWSKIWSEIFGEFLRVFEQYLWDLKKSLM